MEDDEAARGDTMECQLVMWSTLLCDDDVGDDRGGMRVTKEARILLLSRLKSDETTPIQGVLGEVLEQHMFGLALRTKSLKGQQDGCRVK